MKGLSASPARAWVARMEGKGTRSGIARCKRKERAALLFAP